MSLSASPCEHSPALLRAIIRAFPEYYSWSLERQDQFRLNLEGDARFRVQQGLLKELFGLSVGCPEALEEALHDFSDEQYLRLNSAMLPLDGVGEDGFLLNEYLEDGTTLLDFPTVGDYARHHHATQENARREDDPGWDVQPYNGHLYPSWARLFLDGQFHYATLYSLPGFLHDEMESAGRGWIDAAIPHEYVEGKHHGERVKGGYRYDIRVDANGREAQLEELEIRCHAYLNARFHCLQSRLDDRLSPRVFFLSNPDPDPDPHAKYIFSGPTALDAVYFQRFVRDCCAIAGDPAELEEKVEREKTMLLEFLETEYRDIVANFDPTVVPLRKKRQIVLAEGVAEELL